MDCHLWIGLTIQSISAFSIRILVLPVDPKNWISDTILKVFLYPVLSNTFQVSYKFTPNFFLSTGNGAPKVVTVESCYSDTLLKSEFLKNHGSYHKIVLGHHIGISKI